MITSGNSSERSTEESTFVPAPRRTDTNSSFGATVTGLKFYEHPAAWGERVYREEFPQSSARYIAWELLLDHPKNEGRVEFVIDAVYLRSGGEVWGAYSVNAYYEGEWTSSQQSDNWGSSTPGGWPVDTYRVDLSIDGVLVASGEFRIVQPIKTSTPTPSPGRKI